MEIIGHVTYIDLSGGFWGIVASDGQQYQPARPLPSRFQQEGKSVKVKAHPAGGVSIFMWGTQVEIDHIEFA